jgi:FkbM family methyltransferase
MFLLRALKKILRNRGVDIVRYSPSSHTLARRASLISLYDINLVLDVGGNIGQYGTQLRDIGYKGKIISFEPLRSAFNELKKTSQPDVLWKAINIALGNEDGKTLINISRNSQSSSICEMLMAHMETAPNSGVIGQEEITIQRLDSIIGDLGSKDANILLKIDTQGYEKNVLEGAEKSLHHIHTIQIEMSLVPLYKDEIPFLDMITLLCQKDYSLISLEPGFANPLTGQLLQVDGIFHRI